MSDLKPGSVPIKHSDLLQTMDAKKWAEEFMRLFGNKREEIDEGLMISWFASAIMVGYDHATNRKIR